MDMHMHFHTHTHMWIKEENLTCTWCAREGHPLYMIYTRMHTHTCIRMPGVTSSLTM